MNEQKLREAVSSLRASETCYEEVLKMTENNKTEPVRRHRSIKIVLIAACLCLALAVTVLAAEVLLPKLKVETFEGVSDYDGSPTVGYDVVVEYDGEVIDTDDSIPVGDSRDSPLGSVKAPVHKLDEELFSEKVLSLVTESEKPEWHRVEFESFAHFEEYIGVELFNNPMLENSPTWSVFRSSTPNEEDAVAYNSVAEILTRDGKLYTMRFDIKYLANYRDVVYQVIYPGKEPIDIDTDPGLTGDELKEIMGKELEENDATLLTCSDFVDVYMTVMVYTENSTVSLSGMMGGAVYPADYSFSVEEYLSPNGIEAVIVSVYDGDGGVFYHALMGLDRACVEFKVYYNERSPEYAMQTIKDIIDAFEF